MNRLTALLAAAAFAFAGATSVSAQTFSEPQRGEIKTARELAARAKMRFPTGTPGWVRADDIVSFKPQGSGN